MVDDRRSPEQIAFLVRVVHKLTICACSTYEKESDRVLEPEILRAYNDLLHRVTGALLHLTLGMEGYSDESIIEMIQAFGLRHNRVTEIEWALDRTAQPPSTKQAGAGK